MSPGTRQHPAGEPRGFARYMLSAAIITVLGYSLGYSTIGFALLLFGTLWSVARYRTFPWAQTSLDLPLAAFGAAVLVSAVLSPFRPLAPGVTLVLLASGAVYFGSFTWLLHAAPGARTHLLRVWAGGAVMAAVAGLAYGTAVSRFVEHGVWVPGRAEIPRGVGPNGLGTTLMLGGILSLGLAFRAGGRERHLWTGAGLLCLTGLLASGSRASLAGWIAGAAYLVWRELRARPRRMAAVAVAGLVLLVGIAAATPQFASRFGNTLTDVAGNRVQIWRTSLEMIAERPLLGTGFGTFERAYDRRRAARMSPEPFAFNLWLNLAVETGLLGLASALWVAVEAVQAWRQHAALGSDRGTSQEADLWRPVVAALWAGLLVDQFADNTLFSISTSAALWLLLALSVVPPSPGHRPAAPLAPVPANCAHQRWVIR